MIENTVERVWCHDCKAWVEGENAEPDYIDIVCEHCGSDIVCDGCGAAWTMTHECPDATSGGE